MLRRLAWRPVVLIGPPQPPHPPGLRHEGLAPRQLVWLQAASPAERLWSADQLVKAHTGALLVAWLLSMAASFVPVLGMFAGFLITPFLSAGLLVLLHKADEQRGPTVGDLFAPFSTHFVPLLLVDRMGYRQAPVVLTQLPPGAPNVARELVRLGGAPEWRMGFTTDNGNVVLDIHNLSITDPVAMEREINQIPGVVAVGLFARRPADIVIVGGEPPVVLR